MAPLLAFAPGPAGGSRGTLDANIVVKGLDIRTAQVAGELHMRDARVPLAPQLGTLRNANIDIKIEQHDIKLGVTGKLGKGDIKVDGSIALDGASLTGGQATVTLRKVSPLGAVQPLVDADIVAKISRKNTTWIADVTVDHGFVNITSTKGEKLKPVSNPADLRIGTKAPTMSDRPVAAVPGAPAAPILIANVKINPVKVESDEFRTTLSGKIKLTADADAVGAVGGIEAHGGNVDLFDRRYRIDHANVRFDGNIDPVLDIEITYDFPDVTTMTKVQGRLSKPELELSASPNQYTKEQLLGFLLGGEPNGDPNNGSARDKAAQAGESLIANQLGGYVKKALPFSIDVIKYEAASVDSSAAVTVGSWITHSVFFSVTQHLDALPDENDDEATIQYWLTRRLEIEGTVGDRNFDGADLLWRRRF